MAKVQVVQRFVGPTSAHRKHPYVIPKVHILDIKRGRIRSSKWISNNRNYCKTVKKHLQNILRYCAANKLSVTVHCVALLVTSIMIAVETKAFRHHPTAIIVEDDMYPVQKIDFPGVAICNINVISYAKSIQFAQILWKKDEVRKIANLTLETIQTLLKLMGTLYQFEHKESRPGDLLLLHKILQKAFVEEYDVIEIMKTLTPNCRSLLIDCYWQGKYRKCDEIFVPRWTPEGFCCTFNHVRWTDRFNNERNSNFKIKTERTKVAGMDYGLYVILKPELEDYYYRTLPALGFKVLFYKASDYPDGPSGGLREVLIGPKSENFLSIKATSLYSSHEIIKYNAEQRKCLFNTEKYEVYGGEYSYSQCMMLCRIRDIRKACGCIPFFYPTPDDVGTLKMCRISDLKCLQLNKDKWWSIEPIENAFEDHPSPKITGESHLHCDCWPTCDHVDYTIHKSSCDIHHSSMPRTGCMNENLTVNSLVLIMNFGSIGVTRLRHEVVLHWYDLISNYGGLCSLFLGISIITPIEVIYLLCLRFWQVMRVEPISQIQVIPAVPLKIQKHDQSIFWNEMIPSKRPI